MNDEQREQALDKEREELEKMYDKLEASFTEEPAEPESPPAEEAAAPVTETEEPAQESVDTPVEESAEEGAPTQEEASASGQEVQNQPEEPDETELWRKRYKDVQSWSTKVSVENAELRKKTELLQSQLESFMAKLNQAPDGMTEAQKKFKEEYPELGELLTPVLKDMLEANVMPLKHQLEELRAMREATNAADIERQIRSVHEDFDEVKSSNYFKHWLVMDGDGPTDLSRRQKEAILASNDPADGVRLITQFKEEFKRKFRPNQPGTKKKSKTDISPQEAAALTDEPKPRASSLPVNQKPKSFSDRVDKMSLSEFEKHRDEIWGEVEKALQESALG